MDKPSERKKDSKAWGDTDAGTERKFGPVQCARST